MTIEAVRGLVLWGFIAALCYAMPALTRPELYFAVTVPAEFRGRSEARSALRRYHRRVVRNAGLALIAVGLGAWRRQPAWFEVSTLGQVVGQVHAFLVARRAIAPFAVAPSSEREAAMEPRPGLPGGIPAQLGPFALLAATTAYVALDPARPGAPSRYGGLVTAVAMCGTLLVTALCLAYRSRRIRASGGARQGEQRFRDITLGVLLGTEYLTAGSASAAALWYPRATPGGVRDAIVLATLALALVTTFWLGRLGQGGARRAPAASGGSPVGDGTVDAHWKLGLIYVNRDDPAVFVEKRFGIGYTLNFGNPQAWAVLAVMVVAATIALVLGWR